MKYIFLGTIGTSWLSKQGERYMKASAKLKQLGINLESVHYTQGQYDFVDVVDAPGPEAVLAFSIWYTKNQLNEPVTLIEIPLGSIARRRREFFWVLSALLNIFLQILVSK